MEQWGVEGEHCWECTGEHWAVRSRCRFLASFLLTHLVHQHSVIDSGHHHLGPGGGGGHHPDLLHIFRNSLGGTHYGAHVVLATTTLAPVLEVQEQSLGSRKQEKETEQHPD